MNSMMIQNQSLPLLGAESVLGLARTSAHSLHTVHSRWTARSLAAAGHDEAAELGG